MKGIIAIVFFARLANADEWTERYLFAKTSEELLKKHLELPHVIPSHDMIRRVFAPVSPECPQELRTR